MPRASGSTATVAEDLELDRRVRALETTSIRFGVLFDSDAGPGLLSNMKAALLEKIDAYAQTVNTFIAGEPQRKQHIERNTQQAVVDAKTLAEIALRTAEEKQNRLHEENRRDSELKDRKIDQLGEKLNRHEKFVQRGIGIVIAGQVLIVVGGAAMAFLTAFAGFLWWVVVHAHDFPVR